MIKKLKFLIIYNSNAAGGKKLKLINKVIELLKNDHDVELFKTSSEENAKKIFKDLSKKSFDRLIIAGGDGSVCFAINQLVKSFDKNSIPVLGYIPAGTTNILQFELNVKQKAKAIYKMLVSDKIKNIHLAKINDKYFFLMTGIGF